MRTFCDLHDPSSYPPPLPTDVTVVSSPTSQPTAVLPYRLGYLLATLSSRCRHAGALCRPQSCFVPLPSQPKGRSCRCLCSLVVVVVVVLLLLTGAWFNRRVAHAVENISEMVPFLLDVLFEHRSLGRELLPAQV